MTNEHINEQNILSNNCHKARIYSGQFKGKKTRIHEQENEIIEQALSILTSRLKEKGEQFDSSNRVRDFLRLQLEQKDREHFAVIFMDSQHRLIEYKVLFSGTINEVTVYPREVVKMALLCNATAIVITHNHPSGDPEPSSSDMAITRELLTVLHLINVRLLDHMIIGNNMIVSMNDRNLL